LVERFSQKLNLQKTDSALENSRMFMKKTGCISVANDRITDAEIEMIQFSIVTKPTVEQLKKIEEISKTVIIGFDVLHEDGNWEYGRTFQGLKEELNIE
jgi:hypothetical protein